MTIKYKIAALQFSRFQTSTSTLSEYFGPTSASYLHACHIHKCMSLDFRVLYFDSYNGAILECGFVNLGQGGGPQRLIIYARENVQQLSQDKPTGGTKCQHTHSCQHIERMLKQLQ